MSSKNFFKVAIVLFIFVLGIFVISSLAAASTLKLEFKSSGIINGKIAEKYGMYGNLKNYVPKVSIPIIVKKSPKATKYYAVYMYDNDVPWVHWLAANYKSKNFKEDANIKNAKSMVQCKNRFVTWGYGGPTPPDKTHTYSIKVYDFKNKVNLKNGFTYSQFNKVVKGKVLATNIIKGKYIKK